jgi:hypothetical protein
METGLLKSALAQFTGTEHYYRLYPKVVLTDGAKYLAETAGCYWLMDLYASYLARLDPDSDSFTCLKLILQGTSAQIVIENGNTHVLAKQLIEYTDFPLDQFMLYAVWSSEFWVVMLTSEY